MSESLDEALIRALALPASSRVDQRVPKKILAEHGAPTSADKRLLTDGIEEVQWLAALKPGTVAVPEYRDERREYLEIAVLRVQVRGGDGVLGTKAVNTNRLAELVHRAVPYPVVLILNMPGGVSISLAHKRVAQNEAGKVVLDGEVFSVPLLQDATSKRALLDALALNRQPHANLMALYQGWMDCLTAAQVERITGQFEVPADPVKAAARGAALRECHRLEQETIRLRGLAAKEKQIAKQVDLNIALQRVYADLAAARAHL